MSTLLRTDVCVHLPAEDYERRVIDANRTLAEPNIVRLDRRPVRGGSWPPNQKEMDRAS